MRPTAPISGQILYAAWNVHLRLAGPFVLPSRARRRALVGLRDLAVRLESMPGIGRVRLLESTVIIPLRGCPRFDVALLVDGTQDAISLARGAIRDSGVADPAFMTDAHNVERFGDTDALDGPILLNHFVSPGSPEELVRVWAGISVWYGNVLGVDNATLLTFDDRSRFVAVNYASVPGPVARFMFDQIMRPSFRTNVLEPLAEVEARALPVFARRIH